MAYETPTAAQLIARYPAFAAVGQSTIESHIADAIGSAVDSSWIAADYGPAAMAKAAHEMALLGLGALAETDKYAAAGVTAIRSGNFQASFSADTVKRKSGGGLSATVYGQAYRLLLRKNKAGPRVVPGRVLPL